MTIELSEYAARVIDSQVKAGRYASPKAAVDAAVARLTSEFTIEPTVEPTGAGKLEALRRLQANMNLSSQDLDRWREQVQGERQARVLLGDRDA